MPTPPSPSPSSLAQTWLVAKSADSVSDPQGAAADSGLIGTTLLGTYTIDRVLGEGGMGRIYAAHHARLPGKQFAIKVLRPELVATARIRARFEREVQAVASIDHPSVLSVVDVGMTAEGWPFMVSEYLHGLDLGAYLHRFGAMPSSRVVQVGCLITEALEAIHQAGVIHRDVKPGNVFLLGNFDGGTPQWDRIKLIDFGLSRILSRDDDLTKTGLVLGTPSYMSPEQAHGLRCDHLTDVYGVGAVLYAAATGFPPFAEGTQQQTVLAVMNREPIRPRLRNAAISEKLEIVIQRAMARSPAERHPSVSALRGALTLLEASPHLRQTVQRGPLSSLGGVRARLVMLGVIATLLTAIGLINVVSAFGHHDRWPLSMTELWLFIVVAFGLASMRLRSFLRRIWSNTATLADLVLRIRRPLVVGLMVYGAGAIVLSLLALQQGEWLLSRLKAISDITPGSHRNEPAWESLLAAAALVAAAVVALRDRARQFALMTWWGRWPRLVGGAVALAAVLLVGRWLLPGVVDASWLAKRAEPSESAVAVPDESGMAIEIPASSASLAPSMTRAPELPADAGAGLSPGSDGTATKTPQTGPSFLVDGGMRDGGEPPAERQEEATRAPASERARTPSVVAFDPRERAPAGGRETVAHSSAPSPSAPVPQRAGPSEIMRERILAQSSRPSDLLDAVMLTERLFLSEPAHAADPMLRRILRAAANVEGPTGQAALRVMGETMGSDGPDLLYELMVHRPALTEAAKQRLARARVRKLFSRPLAIAYDLRFAPSCSARLGLLPRAEREGDQRSINVLSELVGKHQRCGQRGAPCLSPCPNESATFLRSIDTIVRRLRPVQTASVQ